MGQTLMLIHINPWNDDLTLLGKTLRLGFESL
jgi:hypothetical protein